MSENKKILVASVLIAILLAVFYYSFLISMQVPSITTVIIGTLFTIVILFVMFKAFSKIL